MRFLILCFSIFLVACGAAENPAETSTAETETSINVSILADELMADGRKVAALLETVTDAESAEAIKPKLILMMSNYEALETRLDTMETPSLSQMRTILDKAPEIAEVQKTVIEEIRRIHTDHPEAAEILRETFDNYGG